MAGEQAEGGNGRLFGVGAHCVIDEGKRIEELESSYTQLPRFEWFGGSNS
jgi:hypothetical protein